MKAFDESCDDNNTVANDGCSPTCTIETNGNCIHPQNAPSICDICGNSLRKTPEVCDDGTVDNEGCSINCLSILSSWICENGTTSNADSCIPILNDGIIVGTELCDDNNTDSTDGCHNGIISPQYICQSQPSVCALCGDELLR